MSYTKEEREFRAVIIRAIVATRGPDSNYGEIPPRDLSRLFRQCARYAPRPVANVIEKQFRRAVLAWEKGEGSGNSDAYNRWLARCKLYRHAAAAAMALLGIETDYPGLYPTFSVDGFDYCCVFSAIRYATK